MHRGLRAFLVLAALLALAVGAVGQGNPVTNGGFEEVDAAGRPIDWELLGNARAVTEQPHAGKWALRLLRGADTQGEVGLNRRWAPRSGEQGGMLSQRKGGIRFWYKAVAADGRSSLAITVIPMNDKPLEVGGNRVAWYVPARHVGDGQWHQGAVAYDFSKTSDVKWVHVGARLYGERAELWLDDFEWVEQVGPVLQSDGLGLTETAGREGERGTLTLTLRNAGDRPLPAGSASVALPAGLSVGSPRVAVPALQPGKTHEATWDLAGKRDRAAEVIRVAADSGGQQVTDELALRPDVSLVGLHTPKALLTVGETAVVRLLARNGGTAAAAGLKAALHAPGFSVQALSGSGGVRPGKEEPVASWKVTRSSPTPLARLDARLEGIEGEPSLRLAVAERIPVDTRAGGPAYAVVGEGQAVVGSEKVRLILAPAGRGGGKAAFSIGILQARTGRTWRTVARLPRLGLVAVEGAEAALTADGASARQDPGYARLVLAGSIKINGCTWQARWDLAAQSDKECIEFSMSATPSEPTALLALEGPMLYAEDGGTTPREDAIVPGIEWLVRGEESSNSLDFKPEHPDRIRYVPHPLKITVPAVGMKVGDAAVGLFWDVPTEQPSYAKAGALSLAFASPNRFEGYDNHLMGLFLPAVGEWVPENERRASKPLPVAAGQALSIRASLVAVPGARDSLVVLDRYYQRHGFPEPLAYPRRDAKGEIAFSLRGYFKDRALWNPEWKRWYSDLIVGFRPTETPALDLLRGAEFLGTGEVARQSRDLAAEVLGGDERALRLRLEHRADPGALRAWGKRVRGLIAGQHADGTWRFGGEKAGEWPKEGVNYKVLGPVGASEVGLSALNATDVLNYALVSGDPEVRDAGLKALDAMRRFRVPRAAQVWEVPVHTPDILASARAMNAFLAGYRLTGDRRHLDDAVYWARTGLPFVYVWNPADMPDVRGATIPVFGGTHYMLSWLAVAVQWNGLAYSSALFDLADLDNSFPWKRVAENILRSGMYQQATEGDRFAQWPDAVNFIVGRKGPHGTTPPCFQPATIIHQTLRLQGWKVTPEAVAVRQGKQQIALRGQAGFRDASWDGDRVRFQAEFAPPQCGAVEVIGVTRPKEVLLDGKPVAERAVAPPSPPNVGGEGGAIDLQAEDVPGWRWHEGVADLEIRIPSSGKHTVEVRGISRAPLETAPPVRRSMDFRFDRDSDGWVPAHDLSPFRIVGGMLEMTTTGTDPYMTRDGLHVEGRPGDVLVIRLSAAAGSGGSVFWSTDKTPGFSPQREVSIALVGDGKMHELRVPVGEHKAWSGAAITALRIDPGGGAAGARTVIESIRLERGK